MSAKEENREIYYKCLQKKTEIYYKCLPEKKTVKYVTNVYQRRKPRNILQMSTKEEIRAIYYE